MKTKYLFIGLIILFSNCISSLAQESNHKQIVSDTIATPIIDTTHANQDTSINFFSPTIFAQNDTTQQGNAANKSRTEVISSKVETHAEDSIIFSADGKKVFLFGNAEIKYEDIVLQAAYVEVDMEKGILYAEGVEDSVGNIIGQPVFTQEEQEMKAKTITYSIKTEKGFIKGLYTEQEEGFLHSKQTKKEADNSINLHRGKYTTCELEDPHFYVWLSKGKVIPDKAIVAGFSFMVVEDIPLYPLAIPFGFFPSTKEKASGFLIPTFGDERVRGFYLRDGGYYFAFSEYADLALRGDVYSKGTWQIGAQSQYKMRYKFSGRIDVAYSNQVIDESSESSEYRVVWSHTQDPKARPNSNFSANVNFRSSDDSRYNEQNVEDKLNQTISSSISYRKTFANTPFSSSMNIRHNQNLYDSTMQLTIPQMTMNMSRIFPFRKKVAIGKAKWYENIGLSYSGSFDNKTEYFADSLVFTPEVFEYFDYGLKHSVPLSTSLKVFNYFNLSPSVNFTDRMYFKRTIRDYSNSNEDTTYYVENVENGFYNLYDYNLSLGLGTKLYGMYQYKNSKVKAIRHVVTPSVSLGYRPDFSEEQYGFYIQDTSERSGYYNPFADHQIYGMPGTGKSGSVGFTLNNNVEMKVLSAKDTVTGEKKIKLLDALNFSTSYNIIADSMNWAPLSMTARTTLFNTLSINVSASGDFYTIDSLGVRYNEFELNKSGNLFRLTRVTASTGIRLNSKKLFGKSDSESNDATRDEYHASYLEYYNYDYFEIPWNVSFDYSFTYAKPTNESTITQTLGARGDFSLTEKWKIGFSTGWDFKTMEPTTTRFNLSRDLHCWVATVNVVPFGDWQSYNFTIGVKSNILQDLKYNKNKSWLDNSN